VLATLGVVLITFPDKKAPALWLQRQGFGRM